MSPRHADISRLATIALTEIERARQAIEELSIGLEGDVDPPIKEFSKASTDLVAWRASHLRGPPSRRDTDSELRAFVLARIETQTYDQIADAVADAFPPARRTSRSALSRWFRRQNDRHKAAAPIG